MPGLRRGSNSYKFKPYTPNQDTIAYYEFNGNCNDSGPNHYHMTPTGVTYETLSNGRKVAYFNGSTSHAEITGISGSMSELTISVRIKRTRNYADGNFGQIGLAATGGFRMSTKNSTEGNIANVGYDNSWIFSGYANTGISNGTWFNATYVADSTGNKIYINGNQLTLTYNNGNANTALGNRNFDYINIGKHLTANADRTQGYFGNLIFEKKSRTVEKIIENYNRSRYLFTS